MSRENLRNALILVYMVGNALTFNSLLKAERATMIIGESWLPAIVKIMALSLIWPVYWLLRLLT